MDLVRKYEIKENGDLVVEHPSPLEKGNRFIFKKDGTYRRSWEEERVLYWRIFSVGGNLEFSYDMLNWVNFWYLEDRKSDIVKDAIGRWLIETELLT